MLFVLYIYYKSSYDDLCNLCVKGYFIFIVFWWEFGFMIDKFLCGCF